ncbi:hypothetical protein SAMN05421503_1457 [Terribacillus aidingensis]|uniref:Uncharacterized protein n=1 Tax=Terribacillus aidingensis TaxID=586416 RepID=A0A285NL89_9BACI|nr:hypothetical protein [Terribacillus aidingensis]SNZ09998.1 hypothetical protein SAMN05421503_1457 [Terribacillus aidingensis]
MNEDKKNDKQGHYYLATLLVRLFPNQIRTIREKTTHVARDLLKALQEMQQDIEIISEVESELKKTLLQLGFPPNLDHLYTRSYSELLCKIRSSHTEDQLLKDLNEYMCNLFNDEVIDEIFMEWESFHSINRRRKILHEIIECHKHGFYFTSIPAALTQIEGSVMDAFKITGETKNGAHYIMLEELLETDFEKEVHVFYTDHIKGRFILGADLRNAIGRNAILHGYDTGYGTELSSLKVILFLDYLFKRIELLDDSDIKPFLERNRNRIFK